MGGGGVSMQFGCPQVPCFACHPSSRVGWMDFVFAKGFGALWPHPVRSAPSGIAGVRCPWRAGQHPQVLVGLGGCVGYCPPHAPAVCVFRGKNPPPCLLPSLLPYLLNLLSRGIGAATICEPASNGINSFPWPGPSLMAFLAPPARGTRSFCLPGVVGGGGEPACQEMPVVMSQG